MRILILIKMRHLTDGYYKEDLQTKRGERKEIINLFKKQ